MRLVRTVPRPHLVPATPDETDAHVKKMGFYVSIMKDFPFYKVVVGDGESKRMICCVGKLLECRRGFAIFGIFGFLDLEETDGRFRRFPSWYDETHEIFVEDRYLVVLNETPTETTLRYYVYDRERNEGFSLEGSKDDVPGEYAFHERWSRRVRSRFHVGTTNPLSENLEDRSIYLAAWFRDGDAEVLRGVYVSRRKRPDTPNEMFWDSDAAIFFDNYHYVERKTDDEIVLRRLGDDRSFRVPLRLAAGERVEIDERGHVVVDGERETRYYDVDLVAAEKIDGTALPTDVKRDVLRKAAFVDGYSFDFS